MSLFFKNYKNVKNNKINLNENSNYELCKNIFENNNFQKDMREILAPIKNIIFENIYIYFYLFIFLLFINFLLHLGIILLLFKYLNKQN